MVCTPNNLKDYGQTDDRTMFGFNPDQDFMLLEQVPRKERPGFDPLHFLFSIYKRIRIGRTMHTLYKRNMSGRVPGIARQFFSLLDVLV